MKKLLSIASILFVVTMLFSACTTTTTENPFEDLYKFKSTYFEGYAKVNGNFLDLVDFTLTYTGLDGTTKNITPNAKGEYIIEDMGYKLPADIKVVCTMTKKANYEEIKASMEEFDIDVVTPTFAPSYLNPSNDILPLGSGISSQTFTSIGIKPENLDKRLETVLEHMNVTYAGEYTKNGDRAQFVKK